MAININPAAEGNNAIEQAMQQAQAQAQTQGQQQQQQQFAQPGQSDAANIFANFYSPVRPGMVTNSLLEKFTKEIQALDLAQGFTKKVHCLDNAIETDFAFSVITISVSHGTSTVAVPILVEGSGSDVTPVWDNQAGRQVEITRTTVDAFDPILTRKIKEMIKSSTSGTQTVLEGIVFPRETNPEDRMSVLRVVLHAIAMIGAEFSLQSGIDISAEPIKSRMAVDIQFGKVQNTDFMLPKRNDITVSLNVDRQGQTSTNKFYVNSDSSRNETIGKTGAYVDFIYAPGLVLAGGNMGMPTQKSFIANYVITNVKSRVLTPASVMLSVISALSVKNDNVWLNSLKPGFNNSDVGQLNVQGNITADARGVGDVIDTSVASFGVQDLMRLVQALVHDNLIVSIDIDQNDECYAGMSFLEAAAKGKPAALEVIVNACDKLTNGHFSRYWTGGAPVFVNSTKMHRGYYTDNSGVMQDLRNFDYLKVVETLGAKNLDVIVEWNNTFNANLPEVLRLEKRKKILEMVTNGAMHIKGWTERLTFSAAFIDALSSALRGQGAMFKVYQNFSNEFVGGNYANYFASAAIAGNIPAINQSPMGHNPYFSTYRW